METLVVGERSPARERLAAALARRGHRVTGLDTPPATSAGPATPLVVAVAEGRRESTDIVSALRAQPGLARSVVAVALPCADPAAARCALDAGADAYLDLAAGDAALDLQLYQLERLAARLTSLGAEVADDPFRRIVERFPGVAVVADATQGDRLLYISPQIEALLGYTPEECYSRPDLWLDVVHPEDHERLRDAIGRSGLAGEPIGLAFRALHRDGHMVHLHIESTLVCDADGRPRYRHGVITDMTSRVRDEEALRASEERYRTLVERLPAVCYIEPPDPDRGPTYISPQITALLGYTPDEWVGGGVDFWRSRIHPEDLARVLPLYYEAVAAERPYSFEYRIRHRDGHDVWVSDQSTPVRDAAGRVHHWQGFFFDISARKAAEARLQEAEARYRALVEQVPAVIYSETVEEPYGEVYASPQIESLLGYTPEEWRQDRDLWLRILHPDDRERTLAEIARTNATGGPYAIEYRMRHRDGRLVWIRNEAVLIRDADGRPLQWHGVMLDITTRKEAEARLAEAEARYRALVEQIPAVIYIESATQSNVPLFFSPQIEALIGYRPEELVNDPEAFLRCVHPDDRERMLAEVARTDATGEPYLLEYRLLHRDGHVVWIRNQAVLIHDEAGQPLHWQGVIVDITAQKEAELALAEAEARYRALVEQMPALTYVESLDPDAPTIYVSRQITALLGYTQEEWTSTRDIWRDAIHPDDRERILAEHAAAIAAVAPYSLVYRIRHRDGHYVWLRDEAAPVRGEDGQVKYWQGFSVDITAQKEGEARLREAEERFRTLVEQVPAVIYIESATESSVPLYLSPQIEALVGYTAEEWTNNRELFLSRIHPDDRERHAQEVARTDATGEPYLLEYRLLHRDGHVVWIRNQAILVRDEAGRPLRWQGMMVDITDEKRRKETERLLAETTAILATSLDFEETLQRIADLAVPLLGDICTVDLAADERRLERVAVAAREPGWVATSFELARQHPIDVDSDSIVARAYRTGQPQVEQEIELEYYERRVGQDQLDDLRDRAGPVRSALFLPLVARGRSLGVLSVGFFAPHRYSEADIALARELAQRAALALDNARLYREAQEAEARFRTLVEEMPAVTYIQSADDVAATLYVSPQVEAMLGRSAEGALANPYQWLDYVHPDNLPRVLAAHATANATSERLQIEYRYRRPDGRVVWVYDEAVLVRDEAGHPLHWQGVMLDITARKEAELALAAAEARFRALVEQLPVAVYTEANDESGSILYVSPQIEALLGESPDAWEASPGLWLERVHPEDRERLRAAHLRANETGEPFRLEFRGIHRDGGIVWLRSEAVLVPTESGTPVWQGVLIDITEEKRREEADRFLDEVSEVLASSLDYEATLQRIADLAVPTLGDWCFVDVLEGNDLRRVAITCPDPERRALLEEMRRRFPPRLAADHMGGRVIADREPIWYNEVSDDWLQTSAPEPGQAELIRRIGLQAGMTLPLVARGRTLGTINLGSATPHRYHEAAVALALEVARRAALALDNARLYREAQEAEARFRTLVEEMPAVTYIATLDPSPAPVLFVSPQLEALLGEPPEAWLADPRFWVERLHPDDAARVLRRSEETGCTGEPFREEYRLFHRDGHVVWVRDEAVLVYDEEGRPLYWQGILHDITARKAAEALIDGQKQVLELIATGASLPSVLDAIVHLVEGLLPGQRCSVLLLDPGASTLRCAAAPSLPPAFQEAVSGTPVGERSNPCGVAAWRREPVVVRDIEAEEGWGGTRDLARAHGIRAIWSTPIVDSSGQVRGTFAVYAPEPREPGSEDHALVQVATHLAGIAIERSLFEANLAFQAFHDPLTGLPNRVLFLERLQHALDRVEPCPASVAVLFLDLDNFKVVNDTLGHEVGDRLLIEVAERLSHSLRHGDTAARLGGDEFTILLEDVADPLDVTRVADRVIQALRAPFWLSGNEVFVTPSIGIAFGAPDLARPEDLLRAADTAMYRAKRNGKARYETYEPGMNAQVWERLALERDLRRALERGEFTLHYQPIVDIESGRIGGAEALLRWRHPERGLVSPAAFIPIAEETGLIVPIGEWVLREACRQTRAWLDILPPGRPLRMSVNISARQFREPGLARMIDEVLAESGLPPETLRLEITESAAMDDPEATLATLRALTGVGVRLAIDDFGTGYSSLSYLKRLPVDVLKIDRSFVDGLGTEPDDGVIAAGIIELAHGLGLRAVAEGVETAEQLAVLRDLGCDLAQGYYLSPPVDGEALERLLLAAVPLLAGGGE